jgi:IS4 transposase
MLFFSENYKFYPQEKKEISFLERKTGHFSNFISKFVSSENLEAFAKKSGFLVRKSKLSVGAFFDILYGTVADTSPTLTDYSVSFRNDTQQSISKQAIDQRFGKPLKALLEDVATEILSKQIKRKANVKSVGKYFPEIRIMDSTEFKLPKNVAETFPGYGGVGREAIAQLQYEFELLSGKVTQMTIGSSLDSDSTEGMKNINKMPKGTLLIRDLAYFGPKAFKELIDNELYFINRAKSQWNFYQKIKDEFVLLTTADIIKMLKKQKHKYIDLEVFVGENTKTPVRLIANLLTEEQAQKRLRKKSSNRKLGKDAMEAIGLNLFVTNIEQEKCSALAIYELYRLRWQIELVFKTWKSILNLHKIHSMNAVRLECILWVKLIWALLNWSIFMFMQNFSNVELSFHKASRAITRILNINILKDYNLLKNYLEETIKNDLKFFRKEYKKDSKSNDLFNLTFCKSSNYVYICIYKQQEAAS